MVDNLDISRVKVRAFAAKAAMLLARGDKSVAEVAKEIGVSPQTVYLWLKRPAFRLRVSQEENALLEEVRRKGIAARHNRIRHINERHEKIRQIIEERAADPGMQDIPGGKTGMLTHDRKNVGFGENADVVDIYRFDVAIAKELREHEIHIAKEMGQWEETTTTKHEGAVGLFPTQAPQVPMIDLSRLTIEELEQYKAIRQKASPPALPDSRTVSIQSSDASDDDIIDAEVEDLTGDRDATH